MNELRHKTTGVVLTEEAFRNQHPDMAFPAVLADTDVQHLNYQVVTVTPQPKHTEEQYVERNGVVRNAKGQYETAWVVRNYPAAEAAARKASATAHFRRTVIDYVQQRLDAFAASRGYGNADGSGAIVSACSYATSKDPKRAAEAERCVDLRDATWTALYALEADVLAKRKPQPKTIAEVEAYLPALTWNN